MTTVNVPQGFNPAEHIVDLTNVEAGIPILPDGLYLFSVGAGKTWVKAPTDQKDGSFGVRYPLEVKQVIEGGDESFIGKKTFFTGRLHDNDNLGFAKQFVVACNNFHLREESEFDEAFRGQDWNNDWENGKLGEVWETCENQAVLARTSIKPGDGGAQFQQFNWLPVKALEEMQQE